jgi:hypothetical protein
MSEVVAALMPTTARAVGRPVCWWWLAMCRAWRRLSETPVTTTISPGNRKVFAAVAAVVAASRSKPNSKLDSRQHKKFRATNDERRRTRTRAADGGSMTHFYYF